MNFDKLAADIAHATSEPIVQALRELQLQLTRGHLADVDGVEPFMVSKSLSVAPAASATAVLEVPQRRLGVVKGLVISLAQPNRYALDDTTGGAWFQVLRDRTSPRLGYSRINSPFGQPGLPAEVTIPATPASPCAVIMRNAHAVDTLDGLIQWYGWWYADGLGTKLEGVGARLSSP